MKQDFTSINVIIDQSGSMGYLTTDTIGSFNGFVTEQKLVPGDAAFTLCTFNESARLVHDFVKLAAVPALDSKTYRPSGGTALLDAMGTTINSVGAKLAALPEEERPSKVIFLIITDGQENSSRNFTKEQVKSMVEHQRDVYSWEFVFMGANIDAIDEGTSLGIAAQNTMNYAPSAAGTRSLYKSVSSSMTGYRSGNSSKASYFDPNAVPPAPVNPSPTPVTTKTGRDSKGRFTSK